MKTSFKRIYTSIAILFLVIFQACNNPDPVDKAVSPEKEGMDSAGTNDQTAKKIGAFLGGPVDLTRTRNAESQFGTYYGTSGTLDYTPTAVPLTDALIRVLQSQPDSPTKGLVIHYGLSSSKKKIEYVVSLGERIGTTDNFDFAPFIDPPDEAPGAYYILFNGDLTATAPKYIKQDEFCKRVKEYQSSMLYNGSAVGSTANHPYMVYHQGDQLNQFILDNQDPKPTHLYLIHGVASSSAGTFHAPYLALGDNTGPIYLDNDNYGSAIFQMKALDLGHPCPPFCRDNTTPNPICN